MKKILSLTLCILLFAFAIFPASAEVVVQEENYYRDGDYLFEIIEGSEISITYYTGTQSTPIIPSSIGGLPVTHIGERAFFGNDIKEVTIPDGVTHIAEEAFYNCQSLESVTLPKSLESMGTAIFRFCKNLKTVTFSGADTSPILGKYTFYACNSLESVNIPEGVTNIPEGMFAFCESLENITLPQNTESVYDYAFYGSGLRSITLPESLDYIGEMAFADCSSLDEITAIGDSCNAVSDNSFSGTPAGNPFEEPESPTITIFFSNDLFWNEVRAYYCGSYGEFFAWPGVKMTFVETNVYGQDVYKVTIPSTTTCVIFNNNAGARAVDLTNPEDGNLYYLLDNTDGRYELGVAKYETPETNVPISAEVNVKPSIAVVGTDSGIITEDDFLVATTFENVVIREKDLLAEVGAQVEADLGAKMTAATNVRLRGDANCDDQINIRDATTIQKYVASIIKINDSGFYYKNADVDADGKVNVKDATLIQKHLVGMAQIPTGPIQSA